jgi:hypothetical protein
MTHLCRSGRVNPLYFGIVAIRGLDRLTPLFLILSNRAAVRAVRRKDNVRMPTRQGAAGGGRLTF